MWFLGNDVVKQVYASKQAHMHAYIYKVMQESKDCTFVNFCIALYGSLYFTSFVSCMVAAVATTASVACRLNFNVTWKVAFAMCVYACACAPHTIKPFKYNQCMHVRCVYVCMHAYTFGSFVMIRICVEIA